MLNVIKVLIGLGIYSPIQSLIVTIGLRLIKKEWFPSFKDCFWGIYLLFIGIYAIFSKKLYITTYDLTKSSSSKPIRIDINWSLSMDFTHFLILFLSSISIMLGSMFLLKKHHIHFSWKIVFGIFLILFSIVSTLQNL